MHAIVGGLSSIKREPFKFFIDPGSMHNLIDVLGKMMQLKADEGKKLIIIFLLIKRIETLH